MPDDLLVLIMILTAEAVVLSEIPARKPTARYLAVCLGVLAILGVLAPSGMLIASVILALGALAVIALQNGRNRRRRRPRS